MNRENTACFSGHRPERFPNYRQIEFEALLRLLNKRVNEAIDEGYKHFIVGMQKGWDTLAGEAVLSIREEAKPHITLELAIPFEGHAEKLNLTADDRKRYDRLVKEANKISILSRHFYKAAYHNRDIYMIDNSSYLIYFWDGGPGGTSRAVQYAQEQELKMKNLYMRGW